MTVAHAQRPSKLAERLTVVLDIPAGTTLTDEVITQVANFAAARTRWTLGRKVRAEEQMRREQDKAARAARFREGMAAKHGVKERRSQ